MTYRTAHGKRRSGVGALNPSSCYKTFMNFTLYPISWVADAIDDVPFDQGRLPIDIAEGVRIESVREHFRERAFELWSSRVGTIVVDELERVRFALVHRYTPDPIVVDGEVIGEQRRSADSQNLVRMLAACLRLIRPMRQSALMIHGKVRDEDGSFDVGGFDVPPSHLIEVPEVQKLFKLRNQDADDLQILARQFLKGMRGAVWKFRMAVQFHELGHFQVIDWKARFLQWCSAIESIYTTHHPEHQGKLLATSRIKWFLGQNTNIYAPGDLIDLIQDPGITVGQIVDDLYDMRNFMAHGDRIPDPYFRDELRTGLNGGVKRGEVLLEAASFIVRTSLLKILRDNLLNHFTDAGPAEAYFGAQGLTNTAIRAASGA
jgi:hypothetical protein